MQSQSAISDSRAKQEDTPRHQKAIDVGVTRPTETERCQTAMSIICPTVF